MGREIKFRLWNDLTIAMYYSHRPDGSNNPLWGWDAVFTDHIKMASTHLMQYTGLKDKNGKEIYEGDLLYNYAFDDVWEVCYEDASFVAKLLAKHDPFRHTTLLGGLVGFEVVGNIHENPELMEV